MTTNSIRRSADTMPEPLLLELDDTQAAQAVFGHRDDNLRLLADELTVDIHTRGTRVTVSGDPVDAELAVRVLTELYGLARGGHGISSEDFVRAAAILRTRPDASLAPGRRLQKSNGSCLPSTWM